MAKTVIFPLKSTPQTIFHIRKIFRVNHISLPHIRKSQFSSVAQLCLTLCDLMDCSTPGFPVHHQLLELTHVH